MWTPGYYRWDGHAYVWVPGALRGSPMARSVKDTATLGLVGTTARGVRGGALAVRTRETKSQSQKERTIMKRYAPYLLLSLLFGVSIVLAVKVTTD